MTQALWVERTTALLILTFLIVSPAGAIYVDIAKDSCTIASNDRVSLVYGR